MLRDSYNRFGFEWSTLTEMNNFYDWHFKSWLGQLDVKIFRGKSVVDAGCGMGRNSYFAFKYGAGSVLSFDYDKRTVQAARRTLSRFKGSKVEYRNIYGLPYSDKFDIAMCIGVIHHLKDPDLAVSNLIKSLKKGGILLLWVYGDDRKVFIKTINLFRKITSRLPPRLLWRFTYFFSIPFYFSIKAFKPKDTYLSHLSASSLRHVHGIIFDQLLPFISRYYNRGEAFKLIDRPQLEDKRIFHVNRNSWTLLATKK